MAWVYCDSCKAEIDAPRAVEDAVSNELACGVCGAVHEFDGSELLIEIIINMQQRIEQLEDMVML